MTASPPAVELTDVAISRNGRPVWSDGSFSIPTGGVVAVIGPNGSGKTTLLEMLLGILTPSSGTVRVLGDNPHRGDSRIGYVPQNYTAAVGDAVRCRDLVTLGMTGRRWGLGRTRPGESTAVTTALAAVGAGAFADQRMSEVSGGQQQRVAIAQGLVHSPELLLLDEPLANLDVGSQHGIVQLLGDLTATTGITVVLVTHDLNPLLPVLTGAVYLLDGHAHYDGIDNVVDEELLSHLYGTSMRVVRTPQGDLFTRST